MRKEFTNEERAKAAEEMAITELIGKFRYMSDDEIYEALFDITYCDIVECCETCPRYGDDCDGDFESEVEE